MQSDIETIGTCNKRVIMLDINSLFMQRRSRMNLALPPREFLISSDHLIREQKHYKLTLASWRTSVPK